MPSIIAATALQAPAITNLTARGDTAGTGVYLEWTSPIDTLLWATEVWVSTTNNRTTATLYKTVTDNNTLYVGTAGITYYFWVRNVTTFAKSNGAWYPLSSTAGVSSLVELITLTDMAPNSVSVNYFSYDASSYAGAGGAFYSGIFTLSVTNDSAAWLPMSFIYTCKQSYFGAAVNTMWKLTNTTTATDIINLGTFTDKVQLVTVSTVFLLPPSTTHNITLYWYGANSTVSRSNGSLQLLGLKL